MSVPHDLEKFCSESICCLIQALDKIRFLALTDKEVLGEGDNTKLEIEVSDLYHIELLNLCWLHIENFLLISFNFG